MIKKLATGMPRKKECVMECRGSLGEIAELCRRMTQRRTRDEAGQLDNFSVDQVIRHRIRKRRSDPESTSPNRLGFGVPYDEPDMKRTQSEIETYVDAELAAVMGVVSGWAVTRPYQAPLTWVIEKTALAPGEWPSKDFQLHVSGDFEWFILTYGNSDRGCLSLDQAFQLARVISTETLRRWPLRDCVRHTLDHCQPNEWGYT